MQTCPHANSCLTCPLFLTTAEFLPQHHAQRQATLQIITAAEAAGHARVAEMNRQVAGNLGQDHRRPGSRRRQRAGGSRRCAPEPLAAAAARRHELTRAKAIQALRELDRAGAPVTFASVAATAGISRSWLYTQPDISGQIHGLRAAAAPPAPRAIPARQRATDASLRARLTVALDRNRQLADENTRLRRQLARALGDQLSARLRSGNDPTAERPRSGLARVPSATLSTTGRRRSQPRLTRKLKITFVQWILGHAHLSTTEL